VTDVPSIPDLLELKPVADDTYESRALYDAPWGMFGGQAVAQSLIAAGLTVAADRLPHSLHGYFVRRGDSAKPTQFRVDRDRDGRSFSARRVVALQDGEVIFSMSASFTVPGSARRPFPDEEAEPLPDMPPVDSLLPWASVKHSSFEFRRADTRDLLDETVDASPLDDVTGLFYVTGWTILHNAGYAVIQERQAVSPDNDAIIVGQQPSGGTLSIPPGPVTIWVGFVPPVFNPPPPPPPEPVFE